MSKNSILDVMDRPNKKREADKQKDVKAKKRGNFLVRNAKWLLIIFANIVVLVFDVLLASTIYEHTRDYILVVLSLLPSGVPLILGELGWLYPLASSYQKKKALWMVGVGAFSALFTGIFSIIAALFPSTWTWVSVTLLIYCAPIILWHAYNSALYFYNDPVILRDHDLQVLTSENEHQRETTSYAKEWLADLRQVLTEENALRSEFGNEVVDKAIARLNNLEETTGKDINGDGFIGDPNKGVRAQPRRPMQATPPDMAQNVSVDPIMRENRNSRPE